MSLTTTHGLKPVATRPVIVRADACGRLSYAEGLGTASYPKGAVVLHTNCRNCGAPVQGQVCTYCGTRYEV